MTSRPPLSLHRTARPLCTEYGEVTATAATTTAGVLNMEVVNGAGCESNPIQHFPRTLGLLEGEFKI